MLKKIFVFVLAIVTLSSVCFATACGGSGEDEKPTPPQNVQAVIDLIDAIPNEINGYSAGNIEVAEKAYGELTDEEKAQVSNYIDMVSARESYDQKYISVLSMTDLELFSDYSYWFSNSTDIELSLYDEPTYGKLLKIVQKEKSGTIVLKYRTDAIDLSGCTKIVFTILNGSGVQASFDVKASGEFTGIDVSLGVGSWLVVEKDASTYKGINDDNGSPKEGEGQFGIWYAAQGVYYLAGIYAEKAQ